MTDHEHDHAPSEDLIRQVGHIILDGITAADVESENAMELALGRLLEIEALEVSYDEDEGELELDISPLMGGVLLVVAQLVDELVARDGSTPEDVLALVRSRLDA